MTLTTAAETDAAIERAAAAQVSWRAVAPGDRAALLRRFAAEVDAHVAELAELEVAGSGHPIGQATWEAQHVRDVLLYYAAAPERLTGRQIPVAGGLNVTFHEPLGVVGLIVPWNFPMPIFCSAGVTAACWRLGGGRRRRGHPAEMTWPTADQDRAAALAAGLPAGVLTVLPGKGSVVGQRLVDHPLVRKIVFTGSTEVGREIMAGCARQVKRVTLELGGKSANIVFADADLERAAATAPYAVFDNAGQDRWRPGPASWCRGRCSTGSWSSSSQAVAGVRVGDPAAPRRRRWARSSPQRTGTEVASYVPDGAPVAFRGAAPGGPGFWFPPTVLAPAGADSPAFTDEVFGPVVTVTPFEDEADAITIANDTPYGLSGSIWTEATSGARSGSPAGWRPATCR